MARSLTQKSKILPDRPRKFDNATAIVEKMYWEEQLFLQALDTLVANEVSDADLKEGL